MSKTRPHILKLAAAAFLFLSAGMSMSKAQDIIMPERWKTALTEVHPIFRQDTLTIRFLGDVMMHSAQIADAHRSGDEYDFSSYFRLIEDDIRNADIAVANMEFTLAGEPYTGYPCFSAPDTLAYHLADCGFDVFLAANNHIFDKGTKGVLRTIRTYRKLWRERGIRFTGVADDTQELQSNNPLILRRKGISIALLNFTYGTNMGLGGIWPKTNRMGDRKSIQDALSKAEENDADFIIALPHWGTEYQLSHSSEQEEYARWLVENGVDFIIGAHPHVVQDFDMIDNVPVVYSLGNAISNMSAANTQLELLATIRIIRKQNGDIVSLPIELEYLWCSRPGGYNNSYTVIPVTGFIGRSEEWLNKADYDKMISTYERVRKETGIE